jgi:hypothetical protein
MSSTSTLIEEGWSISSGYELFRNYKSNELEKNYSTSNQILLTGYIFSHDCQEFLNQNRELVLAIPEITNLVNTTLNEAIVPSFEIIEDYEDSSDVRRLSITFKIQNKPYEDILQVWDTVSNDVYQKIDAATKV